MPSTGSFRRKKRRKAPLSQYIVRALAANHGSVLVGDKTGPHQHRLQVHMRPLLQLLGSIALSTCGLFTVVGCHSAHTRDTHSPAAVAEPSAPPEAERDKAWSRRAAVVNVDPGNAVSQRRSESHFSPRTSKASVDSHTSSLAIQVAALNQLGSIHKPLIEQQMRDLGLDVTAIRQSKLHKPNSYNVLVEDVTYVEDVERKHEWEPIVYTMTPAIHVRIISANERSTFEAPPITVRSYGPLTAQAAEGYGQKLAAARLNLGKRLIEWLESRLPRGEESKSQEKAATATDTSTTATKPALARR